MHLALISFVGRPYRTWSSDAIRLEPANRVNFNPPLKGLSANAHFNVTCIQAHHVAQDDHRGLGGFFPVACIVEPLKLSSRLAKVNPKSSRMSPPLPL